MLAEAVEAVLAQSPPPLELLLVIDHNEALLERARAEWSEPVRVMANEEGRGPLRRPQHRGAPRARRHRRLPGRRRRAGARLAAGPRRRLRGVGRHGRRRHRLAAVGEAPAGLDPGRVPLGDGVQLPGHPAGGRRREEPDRRQHVLPARGRDDGRRVRLRPRPRREDARWGARRRTCRSAPTRRTRADRSHGARGPRRTTSCPKGRTTWRYFRSRCWSEGLSKAVMTGRVGSDDGLASERAYVTRTLPSGVAHGVADALRGKPEGLRRAGAIIAGLGLTVAGYARGKAARAPSPGPRARRRRVPPARPASCGS